MDGTTIADAAQSAVYTAGTLGSLYLSLRYIVKPMIISIAPIASILEFQRDLYTTAVTERARIAIELGKAGRSPKDISDILDASVQIPVIEHDAILKQEVQQRQPVAETPVS
ncbi:MAG: hypothetical protein Q7R76_00680 [Candidatus Woesearchaeota archaeon]|nr:hypothetical protein [Candidatus Woesearchaeota archaeon]